MHSDRIYRQSSRLLKFFLGDNKFKACHRVLLLAAFLPVAAQATNLYWDTNGATAGAGGASPSGTWDDVTSDWTANAAGVSATTTWTSGSAAIFSAGSDATGSYTITLSGTQNASAITFSNGTATLMGDPLLLASPAQVSVIPPSSKGVIASPILGTSGLTKNSSGELVLQATNTFTGNLTNRAGTVTLDNNLAGGGGSIVLNPVSSPVTLHSSQAATALTNNVALLGSASTVEIDADVNNTLTLSGVVNGPHNWSANGRGTVVLNGTSANTFAGVLTVAQGTLVVAKDGALGGTVNGTTVSNNATLAFDSGFEYTANELITLNGPGAGGGAALNNLTGANVFDGTVILATDSPVGASAGSLNLVGPVTGSFNLTKVGTGEVDLTGGGNTYGSTLVSQGTFGVWSPSSAGTGLVTVNSGAAFVGDGSSAAPGGVNLSGTISPGGGVPDTLGTAGETWNGGGSYLWSVNDATGTQGGSLGFATLNISGTLNITATSGSLFTIKVVSLDPGDDLTGDAADFDNTAEYTWTIATASSITGFDASKFAIDPSDFINDTGNGAFILQQTNNSIILHFVQKPLITTGPISQTVPRYGSVTFSVAATGTPTLHYQWYDQNGHPVGTDSTSYTKNNLAFTDAGTYTVVVTNLSGASASASAMLTVIKATPIVTATGGSFVYNAQPETGSGTATGGAGETLGVTFTYNGTGSTSYGPTANAPRNVGTYTVTAFTSGDGNNFSRSSLPAALTITPASLTLTAGTNVKKYDFTTSATNVPTTTGLLSPDTLGATTVVYDNKNVGTGKTLTIMSYVINDSNGGGNYTVTTQTSMGGEIDKASLTLTPGTNIKTYDTTTSATNVPSSTGLFGTDSVSGTTVVYDNKNAGTGKTLSVTAYTVNDGHGGGNYTVTLQTSTGGEVDTANLTLTPTTNVKVYDTTTSATNVPTATGLLSPDTVSGTTVVYDNSNAGMGKTLSVTAYTVNDGNGGHNYTVTPQSSTGGEIDKASVTLTPSASAKPYDATTASASVPTPSTLLGSDTVSGTVTYDNKNVGTGKTLTIQAYTVSDGNNGGNYTVTTQTSTGGEIDKTNITVSAVADTKQFDGTATSSATPQVTSGSIQPGDSPVFSQRFDTPTVGSGKVLTPSGQVNDGFGGLDYAYTFATVNTGVITPAPAPLVVYVDAHYNGQTNNTFVNWPYTGAGTNIVGYNAFAKVQDAVNAVAPGGTVNVAAGSYAESVTVSRPMALFGADSATLGGGTQSVVNAGPTGTAMTVTANNVTVQGFDLIGAIGLTAAGCTNPIVQNNTVSVGAYGIALQSVAGAFTVESNTVSVGATEIAGNPCIGILLAGISGSGSQTVQGNGVSGPLYGYLLSDVNAASPLTIEGGSITGVMQGVAALNANLARTQPKKSVFTISDVTMSGFNGTSVNPALNLRAGVYIYTTGADTTATITATLTNLNISGTGKISPDSAGVDLADFSTGSGTRQQVAVQNCNISANDNRGVFISGPNAIATVAGSTVSGNGFNPYITGGNWGFGLIARSNSVLTVSNCFISNPSTSAANVYAIGADANINAQGPTFVAYNNSILNNGNPLGKLAAQSAGTLNASGNYWGTTSDTAIAGLMVGIVDFTPYLDSGTDTDLVASGFQGDFSTLHVTTLGAQTGSGGRIQEGINLIADGSQTGGSRQVLVGPGTYSEINTPAYTGILLNKPLTMMSTAGAATTIINGSMQYMVEIDASDVTLDGFTVTDPTYSNGGWGGDGTGIYVDPWPPSNLSNVHIKNCVVHDLGDRYVAIYGDSGPNLEIDHCTIYNINGYTLPQHVLDYNDLAFGIRVSDYLPNATVSVHDNNIHDIFPRAHSAGIDLGHNVVSANVNQNQITLNSACTAGILLEPSVTGPVSVSNNTIAGSTNGIMLQSPFAQTVTGNNISGAMASIYVLNSAATIKANSASIGSQIGIWASGSTAKALIESNSLVGDSVAAIKVDGGATVDAGDCSSGNVTGLGSGSGLNGSSTGGNIMTGYGFDGTAPWAVENLNSGTPAVLAYQNSYGAVVGNNLATLFTGNVLGDQSGGLLVQYPAALNLQCLANVPAGATDATGFVAQGGAVSATGFTVSFSDAVVSSTPNNRVITRTYTITDACSSTSANQIINVNDTIPPVVTVLSPSLTIDVAGQCDALVPDLSTNVSVTDNCLGYHIAQNPPAGTPISLGSTNVTVVVTDDSTNSVTVSVALNVIDSSPSPATVFVDAAYAGLPSGAVVTFPVSGGTGTHYIGCDAFVTIQNGINRAASGGTVNVAAGRYVESVNIAKPLALLGPNASINPVTGTRVAEAVVQPNFSDPEIYDVNAEVVINIAASHVTIKGFTVDGYNPDLSGAFRSGVDLFNAAADIADYNADNSLIVANNIVKNASYAGIDIEAPNAVNIDSSDIHITGNLVENMDYNTEGFGCGVVLYHNVYAEISGNFLTNCAIGITPQWYYTANTGGPECQLISSNTIYASLLGIWFNLAYSDASTVELVDNTSVFMPTNGSVLYGPAEWDAIEITSIQQAVGVLASNNIVAGTPGNVGYNQVGYNIWSTPTTAGVNLVGGSVSNANYGVWVNNYDGYVQPATNNPASPYPATSVIVSNLTINSSSLAGIYVQDDPRASAIARAQAVSATVIGNTVIADSSVGVLVQGVDASASVLNNNASITGNGIGVDVDGGQALLQNNDLTANTVAGIWATNGAVVDAGSCSGDAHALGSTGGNNLSGYLTGAAKAIINGNTSGTPEVLAEHDNFGASTPADSIPGAFSGAVEYSQSPVVIAAPGPVLVTCALDLQPAVTTFADFETAGGYFAANSPLVVTSVDSTNYSHPPFTGSGVITRTYTLTDACGAASQVAQTITFSDTTPPTFTQAPTDVTYPADLGECSKSNVTWVVTGSDNCLVLSVVSIPPSGSTFMKGVWPVTNIVTDTSGNTATNIFHVTILDTQKPIFVTPPVDATVVADINAQASLPDVTVGVVAVDNCDTPTLTQYPAPGTVEGLGVFPVTVWAADTSGNSNSVTVHITVVDKAAPTWTYFAPNLTVTTLQDKDPYATGTPVATDADQTPTITYNDNRSGLSGPDSTGHILRTWTATDSFNNTTNYVQAITVVDTNTPYFTTVTADITVTNDPGQCSAVVTYSPAAMDLGYFQGFENPAWTSGSADTQPSTDWNEDHSHITRVASGTDGITSSGGAGHAVIDSTGAILADNSGAFSRLGGYNSVFGNGFRVSQDIYIDVHDPGVVNATATSGYAWDLSVAVNDQSGVNHRDFIMHAAAYDPSGVVIAADNGSADSVANHDDYRGYPNTAKVTTSGWYTFQWLFRATNNVLAVDLSMADSSGNVLFTQTLSDPSDLISTVVGGHRYLWFTFINANKLAIDNTKFERVIPVTSTIASGTAFPVDTVTVTNSAVDAIGNSTNITFNVTVLDKEPPVIPAIANIVLTNTLGVCTVPVTYAALDVTDNCAVASTNFTPVTGSGFGIGTTPVTVVAEDIHGNYATNGFTVTVIDTTATALGTSMTPQVYGQDITLTATVSACPAQPITGGTVTFYDGVTVLGTGTLGSIDINGTATATLDIAMLTKGDHNLTATYAGDALHLSSSSAAQTQTITPATLTVSGIIASNKVYDGNTVATLNVSGAALNGIYFHDDVTLNTGAAVGAFNDKNVGTGKPVAISGLTISGTAAFNYVLVQPSALADITTKAVTITANDDSKTYGDTTTFAGTEFTTSPMIGSESVASVTLTSAGAAATAIVGGYDIVPTAAVAGPNTDLGNYTISYHNGTLTVNPAALSITANNQTKVYGQSFMFAGTEFGSHGLLNHDSISSVTLASDGSDTNANVDHYVITIGSAVGSGLGNYTITYHNGTLTVVPALLAITADDKSRVYGVTNPILTATYSGFVNGQDTSLVTGTPTLTCAVPTNAPIGAYSNSIVVSDAGDLYATNYTFAPLTATNGTLTIVTAQLTPGIVAASRIYDGSAAVTLTTSNLTGIVGTDVVYLVVGTASFDNKNADLDNNSGFVNGYSQSKVVTATGLTLAGPQATNYALATTTATTTADVVERQLDVSATAANRVYDADFDATALVTLSDDRVAGDDVTEDFTDAEFGSVNVGSQTVTVNGISIAGGQDQYNYFLGNTTTTTTATITTLPIRVTAVSDTRTYDGTANSSQTPTFVAEGYTAGTLPGGDMPNFTQSFDTPHAGTGKTLTPAGLVNDGNSGNNYAYTYTPVATGEIDPYGINLTANDASKTYGDTVTFAGTEFTHDLMIGSDQVASVTLTSDGAAATAAVGGYDIVPSAAVGALGTDLSNYSITYLNGTLTVNQAALSITANNQTKVYGQSFAFAGTEFGSHGLLNHDSISSVTLASGGSDTNANVGSYDITISGAVGTGLGNYTITYHDGTLAVTPASLLVSADNTARLYGATNPVFTATYSGFVNAQTLATSDVIGSPSLTTAADTNSPVGPYTITAAIGTLASTNYSFVFSNGTLTVAQAAILVRADNQSRLYGQANPTFTVQYSGFVNGDTTGVLSGAPTVTTTADTNSPVGPYTITVAQGTLSATNYMFATSNALLTVNQTPLDITANDDSKTYDGLGYSSGNGVYYAGFVNAETNNVLGGTLSYTGSSQGAVDVGSYVITPQGLTSGNYAITFHSGTLTVNPRVATVVADAKTKTYGANNPNLTAVVTGQAPSGDVIQYMLGTTATANSTVGSYPITVTLGSNPNYSVTATNSTLTVNPATPMLTITSASPIKYSQPLGASTISGSASNPNNAANVPGSFMFVTPGLVPVATASQSVVFLPGDAVNYTTAFGSVTVPVNDPTIFVQPADVTIPLGSNATFNVTAAGSGTLQYQWQQNGVNLPGQTAATLTLNGVADSAAGQYSVIVSNANGVVTSSNAALTITHPPVFLTQPASVTVNQGATVTFSVSMSGRSPFTYQWSSNGVPVTPWLPVTGNHFTLNNVLGSYSGNYSVEVTNADGLAFSSNALLTVIVPPTITSQPVSLTNNAGTVAVLSVTNTGSPSVYRWYQNGNLLVDGGKITGSSTTTLTISNVLGANGGAYSVIISNAAAAVTSSNAALVVIDPIITGQPVSLTNNLGTAASFTVSAYGTAPAYQWLKNGVVISGATAATYPIASVADTDVAGYSVIVSNAFGTVTSAPPATLTVIDPPIVTHEPASRTNNAGTTATFTVGYTGTAPSFQWYKNGIALSDVTNVSGSGTATLTLANVQDADVGGFSVVLSNAANVVTSSPPATLSVVDAPIITQEPVSRTNNAGTTATFTVGYTGTAPFFQWFKNGTALNNGGNVSGATSATLSLANVQDADVAGYTVTLTNAAGNAASSPAATLSVVDAPIVTHAPSSRTNNAGTTATFTVGYTGTAPSFQWYKDGNPLSDIGNVSGSATATLTLANVQDADVAGYTVRLTNAAGNVVSSPAANLSVINPPTISTQPVSITNNAGTTAMFTVVYTGTAPSFQWYKNNTNALANGGNVSGANSPTLTLNNVFGVDQGGYSVVVSNAAAVLVSSNALLVVNDPVITAQPVGVTNIDGSTVVFAVGVTGTAPVGYQWYQDGFPLDGETGSSLTLDDIADSDAGSYTVTATNVYGSVTSSPAILVTVPPLIVTQPASVIALVGQSVNFSVNVNGATPFTYQWQKNGGNVSGAVNRILTFSSVALGDAGTYRVAVTNPIGTQMSQPATLSVYTTAVPNLTIVYSNGIATVNLTGVPTFNYAIQASTNLMKWSGILTNASPFTITDTNLYQHRFYRGVYLP